MATAFVTGATGFIGSHVALHLLQRGWRVRALRRSNLRSPSLEKADIDWCSGDIRNFEQVLSGMIGCEAVFHVAADYRLWARNPQEIYDTNVTGTGNVLRAALRNRVERVVYTSSVGTLGLRAGGEPADEATPVDLKDMVGHYKKSKFLAEREAERFLDQGLPVVMVHPSTPVGPGDHRPTPTGKIIVDFLNHRMPAFLNTGLNLVHVSDVAAGHLLALERGRVGEKYILGNLNLTLAEIFGVLEKVSGIPAPRYRLPYYPILFLGAVFQAASKITGREPAIPYEGVKMARRFMFFDAGKARRELGIPQTPVELALAEAVAWFRDHGYITRDHRENQSSAH
jgi:dihydroflavonol-4-reductase